MWSQPAHDLLAGCDLLGLDLNDVAFARIYERQHGGKSTKAESTILSQARTRAREAKDSNESDRIRDELAKMGVVLKDTKDGTTWEIAR